jgi:hypothetical protein
MRRFRLGRVLAMAKTGRRTIRIKTCSLPLSFRVPKLFILRDLEAGISYPRPQSHRACMEARQNAETGEVVGFRLDLKWVGNRSARPHGMALP